MFACVLFPVGLIMPSSNYKPPVFVAFPPIDNCVLCVARNNGVSLCFIGNGIWRSDDQATVGRFGVRIQPGTAGLLFGRIVGWNRRKLRRWFFRRRHCNRPGKPIPFGSKTRWVRRTLVVRPFYSRTRSRVGRRVMLVAYAPTPANIIQYTFV